MSDSKVTRARAFVDTVELPEPPAKRGPTRGATAAVAPSATTTALESSKAQASLVGSDILTFGKGVDAVTRQDMLNSSLFAQLVANKKMPDKDRMFDWYDEYFKAINQLGWAVEARDFAVYVEQGQQLEVHKAILAVAAVVLGPATTAYVLLKTSLDALQSMNPDNSWITLFDKQSKSGHTAKFQVGVAEADDQGHLSVSIVAFGLDARSELTQVLFFKLRSDQVTLRHCSGKVAIDTAVMSGIRKTLQDKLVAFADDYIRTMDL